MQFIEDGMCIGLGTGSTANEFILLLSLAINNGMNFKCVATSKKTEDYASSLGIPIFELDEIKALDITIDGADEFDEKMNLIKGGGGALLREKIVASVSKHYVIITDDSKKSINLGTFPLPIEIIRFSPKTTMLKIKLLLLDAGINVDIKLRKNDNGSVFTSDGGNFIVDCACDFIKDPAGIESLIRSVNGVVENGLFIGMADKIVVANENVIEIIEK
ncbi:MAG: ribose 5-phosphate isomerase A [Alphaproteobacteria bacterium]|jgi:ribose 5-phosphate isomerase A